MGDVRAAGFDFFFDLNIFHILYGVVLQSYIILTVLALTCLGTAVTGVLPS